MEQQVAEAAKAVIRPDTDAKTRAAASAFLDHFTRTSEAWDIYAMWVRSFSVQADGETMGMQLLCLQLLQGKIRREVPRGTAHGAANLSSLHQIQSELGNFLQQGPKTSAEVSSACTCLAALAVRCGGLRDLIQSCQSTTTLSPSSSLTLLAMIPLEMESCSDLSTPQVTAELWPFLETVIDFIRRVLTGDSAEGVLPALETLKHWASTCHISLTILNTPTCGGTESLLPVLVHLLSQSHVSGEPFLVQASQALTEAVMVPSDSCSESRKAACQMMFSAIASQGFVVNPLRQASEQEWEDACHALATLICTLASEEVDEVISQPADHLLHLLLQIQNHPFPKTRMAALDCWLTVQEVPTSQRHDNWKAPLFRKVVEGLLKTTAFPAHFHDWEQEVDLDQSEFEEFRTMVQDVYVSAYFLLRAEFVQHLATQIVSSADWTAQEAALFAFCAVSREVCARCKAQAGGTSISKDRERTAEQLLHLVQHLVTTDPSTAKHSLVLSGMVRFIGAYSPAWATKCSPEAILQLLAYLRASLVAAPAAADDTASAIRSVLVGCTNTLLQNPGVQGPLLQNQMEIVDAVLSIGKGEAMATIGVGYTRLLVQMKDEAPRRQMLVNLVGPLLHRGEIALNAIPADGLLSSPESVLAVESLGRYLHALQLIVRFCDTTSSGVNPISEIMTTVWPFLEKASSRAAQFEVVLSNVLAIHEQLLKNLPDLVSPHFHQTIKYVVDAFDRTKHASTLAYMSCAIEGFGSSNVDSFRELLGHVASTLFAYISSEKRVHECTDLIRAFFELNQRYILYCPAALISCPQFASIVSCAAECLTACQGERESTRAAFNFLGQLFGWRSLRLSGESLNAFQAASQLVDEQVAQHGARIAHNCMATLLGGPQMLWPSSTDCLFAIVTSTVSWAVPEDPESNMAQQWMYQANPESSQPEVYHQVVGILLSMARDGPKNKPKAKMLLTDYCKICKGEMTTDALVSYSLP